MSRAAFVLLLAGTLGFAASTEASPASSLAPAGVIVEKVGAGSLGERAGLKPGDVLVSWQLQPSFPANPFPAAAWLATPFDLLETLIEQAPRGRLTLSGSRAGSPRSWTLIEGASVERAAIFARPALSGEALAHYERALRHREKGEAERGWAEWRAATEAAFTARDPASGLWLLYRRAEILLERTEAGWETVPVEAARLLESAGQSLGAAELQAFSGDQWAAKGDGRRSEEAWRRAQACLTRSDPRSLAAARLEAGLARALQAQQSFDLSVPPLRRALTARAAQAPWSLDLAESLLAKAEATSWAGEPASQRLGPLLDSEALLRRLDPGSLRHVRRLLVLADALERLGRTPDAEGFVREALRMALAVAPLSPETVAVYLRLGLYASDRTALFEAENYQRKAIELSERLPPSHRNRQLRASALAGLCSNLAAAGDLEAAEVYGRLAVEAQSELGPSTVGDNLAADVLAFTLLEMGRFDEARSLLLPWLAEPKSREGSTSSRTRTLRILGELELRAGHDLPAAARALQEAREIYESAGARTSAYAYVLRLQAELETALGHPEAALRLLEDALARQRGLIPGSVDEAFSLKLLGQSYQALGRQPEATRFLCAAAQSLDRMGDRVGRSEGGASSFFAARSGFYSECIEALVGQGNQEEAFRVLESGHARGLLEIMARRDLSASELSNENRQERERLRQRYEALYGILASLPDRSDPERESALRAELDALQRELDTLADRMRRESPRFASLHYPQPLSLAEARRALDPGTALLAYSVGERQTTLFVVRAQGDPGPGLTVHRLALGGERLRLEVQAQTTLMMDRRGSVAETRSRSRALYRLLIAPAAKAIAGSERVLIAPDGPLHNLPFAALLGSDGRYLIEAKPIHTIVSVTVYAEIQKERREGVLRQETTVAAFGDPVYPASATQRPSVPGETLAGQTLRGLSLVPLPGTRREVEAIGALYPNSQVFVGSEATEERVKALSRAPRSARILHFAGHAVLDQRMPINSFLAFSLPEHPAPGQENGLLQAWEIFEDVRLDADLVTLSACNTALGKEMGGEGLIGLTRAFQFAGARSVLASLWAIGDGATARFMPRFYEHLRQGLTKDEALRQTQIEWIRDPKRSHPSLWAAFELIGDYR